jgi:hypothetical protein
MMTLIELDPSKHATNEPMAFIGESIATIEPHGVGINSPKTGTRVTLVNGREIFFDQIGYEEFLALVKGSQKS